MKILKPKSKTKKDAFTLIELLTVVSIGSLLSSILLVSIMQARWRAIDTKHYADTLTVQKGLELYYQDTNTYPLIGSTQGSYTGGEIYSSYGLGANSPWSWFSSALVPGYLESMPTTENNGFYLYVPVDSRIGAYPLYVLYPNGAGSGRWICIRSPGYVFGTILSGNTGYADFNNAFYTVNVVISGAHYTGQVQFVAYGGPNITDPNPNQQAQGHSLPGCP